MRRRFGISLMRSPKYMGTQDVGAREGAN